MEDSEKEVLEAFNRAGIGVEGMEPQTQEGVPGASEEVNNNQVNNEQVGEVPETPPNETEASNQTEQTDGDANNGEEVVQETTQPDNENAIDFTEDQYQHLNSTIDEMSGGAFTSLEDLQNSNVFEVYEQNNQLVEQLEALQQEEQKVPFANDLVESLNNYFEGGGQDVGKFIQLNSLNVDEISDEDAVRHQLQLQTPGLEDSQVKAYLKGTYHLHDNEDIEYDESKASSGAINLKIAANQAREYLKNEQSSISYPSNEEREGQYAQLENQRIDAWTEPMENALNSLESINVSIGDGVDFNYQIPQESLNELYQELQQVVETSGIAVGEHAQEHANQIVRNHIVATQFDNIVKAAYQNAKSLADEEWQNKAHNPSAVKPEPGTSSPEPQSDKEETQQLINAIMSVDG